MAVSADGSRLASASRSGVIHLYRRDVAGVREVKSDAKRTERMSAAAGTPAAAFFIEWAARWLRQKYSLDIQAARSK